MPADADPSAADEATRPPDSSPSGDEQEAKFSGASKKQRAARSPGAIAPENSRKAKRRAIREKKRQERKTLWEDAKNLPNLLTFARVLMIPGVLFLLNRGTPRDCIYAAIIYALAAITDALDGWLARRQGLVSVLGKFLDPLADKLIVAATLVWLVAMGRIPAWAVALLISREITITALRSIASTEGLVIAAGESGKSKTALQMIGIICLIIGYPYRVHGIFYDFGVVDLVHIGRLLVYASLVFSLTSAVSYMSLFADAIEHKNKRAG